MGALGGPCLLTCSSPFSAPPPYLVSTCSGRAIASSNEKSGPSDSASTPRYTGHHTASTTLSSFTKISHEHSDFHRRLVFAQNHTLTFNTRHRFPTNPAIPASGLGKLTLDFPHDISHFSFTFPRHFTTPKSTFNSQTSIPTITHVY